MLCYVRRRRAGAVLWFVAEAEGLEVLDYRSILGLDGVDDTGYTSQVTRTAHQD